MADSVFLAQLDALDAQIELLKVQAQGIRHQVTQQEPKMPPTARQSLPERCTDVPSRSCALQDEGARRSLGSFAHPNSWQCAGCRYRDDGQDSSASRTIND